MVFASYRIKVSYRAMVRLQDNVSGIRAAGTAGMILAGKEVVSQVIGLILYYKALWNREEQTRVSTGVPSGTILAVLPTRKNSKQICICT